MKNNTIEKMMGIRKKEGEIEEKIERRRREEDCETEKTVGEKEVSRRFGKGGKRGEEVEENFKRTKLKVRLNHNIKLKVATD